MSSAAQSGQQSTPSTEIQPSDGYVEIVVPVRKVNAARVRFLIRLLRTFFTVDAVRDTDETRVYRVFLTGGVGDGV